MRCLEFARDPLPAGTGAALIDMMDRLERIADVRELRAMLAPR